MAFLLHVLQLMISLNCEMNRKNIKHLRKLVFAERTNIEKHVLKLFEEVGELATEVEIELGMKNRSAGKDGVRGEAVDVVIMALTIFIHNGGRMDQFNKIFESKCNKWKNKLKNKQKSQN